MFKLTFSVAWKTFLIGINELFCENKVLCLQEFSHYFVFGGSFETLNGAIAANGIEFFGNAGGTIDGSILNYSGNPMTLSGNSDLFFNRSGTDEMPAGFGPELILYYVADSYSEVVQ